MIAALLLAAAQSSGAAVHLVGLEHRTWHECVTLAADELSGKPERVEEIVKAIMSGCATAESRTERALLDTMVEAANYKKVDALMTDWRRYEEAWASKVIAAARAMPVQEVGYNE